MALVSIRAMRVVGIGLSFCALAVPTPAAAEWRRLESPNFVVVGDVSARTLREVAVEFEGFRETLTRVLSERNQDGRSDRSPRVPVGARIHALLSPGSTTGPSR